MGALRRKRNQERFSRLPEEEDEFAGEYKVRRPEPARSSHSGLVLVLAFGWIFILFLLAVYFGVSRKQ